MSLQRLLADPVLRAFSLVERGPVLALVRRGYEEQAERLGVEGALAGVVAEVAGGRAPHPVVELPGGERVVVRRYRRGGAMRHLNRDRYFRGHRALEELRATERARAAGVRAPEVLAATERGAWPGYRATLATRWVPGARELAGWLLLHSAGERQAALRAVGRAVGALHAAGIAHPDLNLRNFLVVGNADVLVLDFDRARVGAGPVSAARRARDLWRLARSARKLAAPVDARGWDALRQGYGAAWPLRDSLG